MLSPPSCRRSQPLITPMGRRRATFRHARAMHHVDDQVDILVSGRLLFRQTFPATGSSDDSLAARFSIDSSSLGVFDGGSATHHATCAMAAVPKVCSMLPGCPTNTQLARPISPGMITGCPMCDSRLASPDDRAETPVSLLCDGPRLCGVRRSRAPRAWRCYGNVVDQSHPSSSQFDQTLFQSTPVLATSRAGDCTRRSSLRLALRRDMLPFGTIDRRAGQLPIGKSMPYLSGAYAAQQRIVAYLVAQSARTGMDHHANHVLASPMRGAAWSSKIGHHLHFQKVIAGAQRAALIVARAKARSLTLSGSAPRCVHGLRCATSLSVARPRSTK